MKNTLKWFTALKWLCRRAKEIILRIIEKGQGLPDSIQMDNGVTMIEMNIPGHKAGLVIGKSGETIKQLQVKVASICGGVTEVEVPLLTVYIWGLVFIY